MYLLATIGCLLRVKMEALLTLMETNLGYMGGVPNFFTGFSFEGVVGNLLVGKIL